MAQDYVAKLGEDGAVSGYRMISLLIFTHNIPDVIDRFDKRYNPRQVLLCFLMGCVILLLGLLHLGFLVDFISMPVTCGFTNAAAITIAASQLKSLLGLSGSGNGFIDSLTAVFGNLKSIGIWDTLLGLSSILMLVGLKVM